MDSILNFENDIDVTLLDRMIDSQNDPKVGVVLNQFLNHQLSWTRINSILSRSNNERTKYFALSILEQVIRKQWKNLQPEQRHPILNQLLCIVNFIPQQQQQQQQASQQPSNLLRKKSNSLIAQCLVSVVESTNTSNSNASSNTLVNESLNALKEQMELVDRSILLQSFNLIIERMISMPVYRGTCILLLIEFIQVIGGSTSTTTTTTTTANEQLVIFETIIKSLTRFIPSTFKEINQFFVNNVMQSFSALKDTILLGNRHIVLLGWINDTAISQACLEYWKFMFDNLRDLQSKEMSDSIGQLIEPISRVIYKILKNQDVELIESRELGPEAGILFKNTNDSTDEQWQPISTLLYDALYSISTIYSSHLLKLYFDKLLKFLSKQDLFVPSKFSSIVWCLGVCLERMQIYSDIDNLLSLLYKSKDSISVEYSNLVAIAILYIIRHSQQYLQCKDVKMAPILELILNFIKTESEKTQSLSEMSCLTLLSVFQQRASQIVAEYMNIHITLNEIVQQPNISKQNLGSKRIETDGIVNWILNISTVLQYNSSLAKSSKSAYSTQFNSIIQSLIELYKWSNQLNNDVSYQNHQITIKKSVLDLLEVYIPSMTDDQLLHKLVPLLAVMLEDSRINQSSQQQFIPKGLQFLSVLCGSHASLLSQKPDITLYVLKYFMIPAFAICAGQSAHSSSSSTHTVHLRLYDLMSTIATSPILMIIDPETLSNYFKMIEHSLANTSSDVHSSAMQALLKYYDSATQQHFTPGAKSLSPKAGSAQLILSVPVKNIFIAVLLNLLLNPEYNSSLDLISQCIYKLVLLSRGDGIEVTQALRQRLTPELNSLFRQLAYQYDFDQFDSILKNFTRK
ncbi:hypothetical protein PPL_02927 [Heterostelium album PN500]|uniref:Importin N-terminal domain-containing protein n=1 Tax=Heterostelium pallidum (strain ATCC 26659 / Pp 5 / PN500) TaxID=670386 RepID=D3B3F9_HETP5|nr:hypothetical protein PPL_02927 [Heterostelium album PN500]EFA83857.1 hypothetical protein PPL_02927 [Heterostelium album PN500]|eukprot:XP_020435974.1 hypothetical protein PPL_02927 [Heterostelium album PN500]